MSKLAKALTAAAGNAGAGALYVEDVFSTYLYTGTGATQTITNGIDLDGEGGLVWIKSRNNATTHTLHDTARGPTKRLRINTDAETTVSDLVTSFNSDGFTLGADVGNSGGNFSSAYTYASWTFRKAEKFFDVVTYTGNGVAGRTVAHNLGSTPAVMIFKRTDASSGNWPVYVSALGATEVLRLNITNASFTSSDYFNDTTPTDSVFTVGNSSNINASGGTYVAYLFASDAGGFGDDGSESIIKCGSYTGTGAAGLEVDLGFEPQWLMFKRTDSTSDWSMFDVMRGIATGGDDARLRAQGSDAENTFNYVDVTATGFSLSYGGADMNASGGNYIYIAIRRPMKTPESGTEVFAPSTYAGNDPTPTVITTGFPVDLALTAYRDLANAGAFGFTPRLTEAYMYSATTAAEVATGLAFDSNTSFATDANHWNQSPSNLIGYGFKRATGFFDVVAYTGDKVLGRTVNHNLGVAPELIIIKRRTGQADQWSVGHTDLGWLTRINIDNANAAQSSNNVYWNSTAPTSTQFTIGSLGSMNETGAGFISYLFATLAGVSKVGSYTGTGADLNVDCGFSAGARFILIKRSDSTGDWYVWDSVRGIVAGNDPYLLLNSTAAEVTSTDYIDPLSSGFTVTSSAPAALNASGGNYIFLAIA
jgi:hypothetical protein